MENTPGLEISTDALDRSGAFDPRYTCDFDNSSPEIRWRNEPPETVCFVLMAEDPDSSPPGFTHWIVYNIPKDVHHLPAGIPAQEALPNGIRQGVNSYGKLGYAGPCPPQGDRPHRYVFRIHALRLMPEVPARATREQVIAAIFPLTIASAEFAGRYQRAIQKAG
jgi:Raf kinase inhibitor-like YbhB/YbcL family protein